MAKGGGAAAQASPKKKEEEEKQEEEDESRDRGRFCIFGLDPFFFLQIWFISPLFWVGLGPSVHFLGLLTK